MPVRCLNLRKKAREIREKREGGKETHFVGDAVQPQKALEAIWDGFEVGLRV